MCVFVSVCASLCGCARPHTHISLNHGGHNRPDKTRSPLTDDPKAHPHVPGGALDEVHAAPVHALVLELDVFEEEAVLLAVHPHDRPVAEVLLRPVARVLQALAAGVEAEGESEAGN